MVAITVLVLIPKVEESPEPMESQAMEMALRLCAMPAHQLGFTHPTRLRALLSGLLGAARSSLRENATSGIIATCVYYRGNGAFHVRIEVEPNVCEGFDLLQTAFTGGIANLGGGGIACGRRERDGFRPAALTASADVYESMGLKDRIG